MSYGMMINVMYNKQGVFDALWRWSTTYMQVNNASDPFDGFFAWHCDVEGNVLGSSPASGARYAHAIYA